MDNALSEIAVEGLRILFLLGIPVIIVIGVSGIIISAVQAATALSDSASSYALKVLALVGLLYFLFPLISQSLISLFQIAFA